MQVGGKADEMGWRVYETCKDLGAIIATAHEHSYHRTRTLTSTKEQIVDASCSDPTQSASPRGVPGNPLSSSLAWEGTASGTRSVAFLPRFLTAAKANGPKSTPPAKGPGSAHSLSSSTSTAIPPRHRRTSRTSTGKSLIDSISRSTRTRPSHVPPDLELRLNEHQGGSRQKIARVSRSSVG